LCSGCVVLAGAGRSAVQPWRELNDFDLTPGQRRLIGWVRLTRKYDVFWFWLLIHWEKGQDEPWYLLSDRVGRHDLIRLYRSRMWTEEMYGDLKGHGFDLETTHLDDEMRISPLVLAVCIAFVWLTALGSWVVKWACVILLTIKIAVIRATFASVGIGSHVVFVLANLSTFASYPIV